jgi:hypothetical protein
MLIDLKVTAIGRGEKSVAYAAGANELTVGRFKLALALIAENKNRVYLYED